MSGESVSREEVLSALEHTFAPGAARIEFRHELDLDLAELRSPPMRLGPHLRRLMRRPSRQSLRSLLRVIGRLVMDWAVDLATSRIVRLSKRWADAVGILDFDAHRCMYGYSGAPEVTLVAGAKRWHGRSGTAVESLSEKPASALQPLWLLDLVRGVEEAHVSGEERLDGHTCRRLVGHADLHRAADAVSYELALPSGMDELGQLTRMPLELWVDAERRIRRIRYGGDASSSATMILTLDLREFGVEPPSDWSRLGLAADERHGV